MPNVKQLIRKAVNRLGYDVHRLPDRLDKALYERLYPEESLRSRRFYNIGAGSFYHPYWTNVDYLSDWYAFNREQTLSGIQYDLFSLEPLPVESNSAEIVYTSHTIEHVNDAAVQNMFNEAYRILKPGGIFRVTAPDIDLEYRAYRENDRDFFFWIPMYSIEKHWRAVKFTMPLSQASTAQIFLAHFATSMSVLHADGAPRRISDEELARLFAELGYEPALDYICSQCPIEIQRKYPGNHMNWFNHDKVFAMLRRAGFSEIYRSGYGQSYSPILRNVALFDSTYFQVSLYVEARK